MGNTPLENVAFVGIGELPSGKFPERSYVEATVEVAYQAIRDSGVPRTEIDTILCAAPLGSQQYQADLIFSRAVEELGLIRKAHYNALVHSGGSSSDGMVKIGAGLLLSGQAKNVLVVQAERWGSSPVQEVIDMLATFGIPPEWDGIYGLCYNSVGALMTQRFMFETGTTEEQLASVCVALRKWAELNPNAMFRKPLTLEQVMNSKMISTPVKAFECPYLADGASAFIMTLAENARRYTDTPVYIKGTGGLVTHYSIAQEADLARYGWPEAGQQAFAQAGVGPKDIDLVELYDSYPVVVLAALEGIGLLPKGESGRFVAAGKTWPGGELPMNTNGGLIAAGHTGIGGGMALLVEGVRQLMGKAGARQVPNANLALCSGTGGTYMDSQVLILGR